MAPPGFSSFSNDSFSTFFVGPLFFQMHLNISCVLSPVYDLPHFILSCHQISLTPQILSIVRTLIMSTFPDMYIYVHLYMDISTNTRAGWLFQLGCPDSTRPTLNFSSLTPACCFLAFLAITSSITSQPPMPQILQSHPELCLHLLTPGNHEWISTSIAT